MRKALELLFCNDVRPYIDVNKVAFISDEFIIGSYLVLFEAIDGKIDNLTKNFSGSLKKIPNCNCDLIEISGRVVYPIPIPLDILGNIEQFLEIISTLVPDDVARIISGIIEIIQTIDEELLESLINFILSLITPLPSVDLASKCNIKAIAFNTKISFIG